MGRPKCPSVMKSQTAICYNIGACREVSARIASK
jgi:hypothetical protein